MSITFHLPATQVFEDDLYRLALTIQDDGVVDWSSIRYIEIQVWNSDGRPTMNSRTAPWGAVTSSWYSVWPQQWFKGLEIYDSYKFTVSLRSLYGTIKTASSSTVTIAPYYSN